MEKPLQRKHPCEGAHSHWHPSAQHSSAELWEVVKASTRHPNPAHQGHHPPAVEHPARSRCCPVCPVRGPLSPTTPLEGGCFVSAFSPCLAAAHRPGPRVRGWGRGQSEGTRQEGSPGRWRAQGKQKHTRGHCHGGGQGRVTQGQTSAWVRSCSGQHRAFPPPRAGPPQGQVARAQLCAEGTKPPAARLLATPRVRATTMCLGWALHPHPQPYPPQVPLPGVPGPLRSSPPCPGTPIPPNPPRVPYATAPSPGSPAPCPPGDPPVPPTPASPPWGPLTPAALGTQPQPSRGPQPH